MSSISRWSYTNTAIVYPFVSKDDFTGEVVYGEPYEIACTWTAGAAEVRKDDNGTEFVSESLIWTENPAPKHLDQIEMPGSYGRETIRAIKHWDMSPFGDTPDFELATG